MCTSEKSVSGAKRTLVESAALEDDSPLGQKKTEQKDTADSSLLPAILAAKHEEDPSSGASRRAQAFRGGATT